MSLEKTTTLGKIEVSGRFKNIRIRWDNVIRENGKEISRSYNSAAYSPDTDAANLPAEVQPLAAIYWTDELKAEYAAHIANAVPNVVNV